MKNYIKNLIMASLVVFGLTLAPLGPTAGAVKVIDEACQNAGGGGGEGSGGSGICNSSGDELMPLIKNVINMLLFILGFIAVIMIIIGGIRYTTSNGDSNATKGAKDTILYSVIGLIVAILSFAIVNFVIDNFTGSGGGPA